MREDGRLSPKSYAERLIRGTNQIESTVKHSRNEVLDPFTTFESEESQRYKQEIDSIRKNYNGVIKSVLSAPEEVVMGSQKVLSGALTLGGAAISTPFSPLGERERWFDYKVTKAEDYETFGAYIKGLGTDFLQTTIGWGGKDNQNNWQTGILSLPKWGFNSIASIGKNALSLRPIKTANSFVESVENLGSLASNTLVSSISFFQTGIFGLKNLGYNYINKNKNKSPQPNEEPRARTERVAPNPFDQFQNNQVTNNNQELPPDKNQAAG